jgi:CheY-like chemotaxis protein
VNPHILVVEDDREVDYVLQDMLQRSGYQVELAYNGQTAPSPPYD